MPAAPHGDAKAIRTAVALFERRNGDSLADIRAREVLELMEGSGVVVLRGFQEELEAFEEFTRKFCSRFHRVAARDRLRDQRGDGFTARAPEANFTLLAHSEGTFQPFKPPDLAFFYCLVAPQSPGGEALVIDGRLFLERLPAPLRSRFEAQGAIFEAYWEPARWMAELGIEDRSAFARLAERYPELDCEFDDANLRYRCRHSVIQQDGQGQPAFSNAILAHLPAVRHSAYGNARVYTKATNRVYFGDGEELPDEVVNLLIDIQDEVAFAHRLQPFDLLLIDNTRVMHGRRPMAQDCLRVLLTRFGHFRDSASPEKPAAAG